MKRYKKICVWLLTAGLLLPSLSAAQLKVDIFEGVEGGIPVAVLPFSHENQSIKRNYSSIIASDLAYSGLFSLVSPAVFAKLSVPDDSPASYAVWKEKGIEKVITGEIKRQSGQDDTLTVTLFDIVVKKKLTSWRIPLSKPLVAKTAHHISDLIYKELTGVDGIFSTRLVFVSSEKNDVRTRRYQLKIADADGHNVKTIFNSEHLLLSPVWLPDHERIAYISYENGSPEVIIQTLKSGKRQSLRNQVGPASSIDWSHDGNKIAYASSKDGNSEIYVYDFPSNSTVRVTDNLAIDTEPSFAPNNTLYFTSDRSGSPQIYKRESGTQEAQRITFEGSYNSDADVSPRGERLTYVSIRDGRFTIVIRNLADDQEMEVSLGNLEERPRFAPNGQLISYLNYIGQESTLGLVSVDGLFGKRVFIDAPFVRALSWSPLP